MNGCAHQFLKRSVSQEAFVPVSRRAGVIGAWLRQGGADPGRSLQSLQRSVSARGTTSGESAPSSTASRGSVVQKVREGRQSLGGSGSLARHVPSLILQVREAVDFLELLVVELSHGCCAIEISGQFPEENPHRLDRVLDEERAALVEGIAVAVHI